jgi:D-aminoacyl-tRNA deacylase
MRVVIQRSLKSFVEVAGSRVGEIEKGLALLVCMEVGDNDETIKNAALKILKLRVFPNGTSDKMDQTITQVGGKLLVISQFTLSWRGQKGNRPSFDGSMPPETASLLFEQFCNLLSQEVNVQTGEFGASMKVTIENDGPVTFILEF